MQPPDLFLIKARIVQAGKKRHGLQAFEPCQAQTRLTRSEMPNKANCVELQDIIIMYF